MEKCGFKIISIKDQDIQMKIERKAFIRKLIEIMM